MEERRAAGNAATVVIPVFNGFEATRRCLEALARHTPPSTGLILVDDASTDARVRPLLEEFARGNANASLLANESNVGFVGAANRGIGAAGGDVVILNSDTEVTAGWLEGLTRCRESAAAIGIVCPVSNNATILSLPGMAMLMKRADASADVDGIGAAVAAASTRAYPRLPTAVGFCMLLTRAVIERCGLLDAVYGRGYGEENDLSMRALAAGFEIACADDVYVHHAGEASFGGVSGVGAARDANRSRLERRWPGYSPSVAAWGRGNPLRATIERANAELERRVFPGRLRVLQVLHRYESRGGIEEHTRAVMAALKDDVSFGVVVPHRSAAGWTDFAVERTQPHLRVARMNPELLDPGIFVIGHAASVADKRVDAAFSSLLAGGYDVVHFQSLVDWNTLRLPRKARDAGAAVVLSCHDLTLACADYNMVLGPDGAPCGRDAAHAVDPGCVPCLRSKSAAAGTRAPIPIGDYIDERFAAACDAVDAANVLVCPSEYLAARMRRAFGARCEGKLAVLGHGVRDFPLVYENSSGAALRVAVVGRLNTRKGGGVLIDVARRLAGHPVTFEVWGQAEGRLEAAARAAGIALRGAYDAADLPRLLRGVDLVLVPTLMEESFCLVVSEAQRLGIPVAASRVGAIPERVREGETGFLFSPGEAQAIASILMRLHGDRPALARVAATLRTERPGTIADNARAYRDLYHRLVPRVGEAFANAAPPAPHRDLVSPASKRAHSPLGTDAYDRWLSTENGITECRHPGVGPDPISTIELSRDFRDFNRRIAEATGDWVMIHEEGDTLAPHAGARMAHSCEAHPDALLIYCDDDAISARGERYDPAFKPAFDVELLRHRPYIAGLVAIHRTRFLEAGGLGAPGWAGMADFVLREGGRPGAVVGVRELLCHRLDLNLRDTSIADASTQPAAARPLVSVLVRAAAMPQRAGFFVELLLQRSAGRVGELFIDLPEAQCRAIAAAVTRHGALRLTSVDVAGQSPLALALRHARGEWLAVLDVRCDALVPTWLEQLERGLGPRAAAAACDLAAPTEVLRGWEVLGAGPWSIAGPPPRLREPSALADLYGTPRQVSAIAGRCALVRCSAARTCGALDDMARAGEFDMAHLSLALRKDGWQLLARPFLAARLPAVAALPAPTQGDLTAPPEVGWMRGRWQGAVDVDPFFHPALQVGAETLDVAPRFAAEPAVTRVCGFPFDRWGSGEVRVRQPLAALERAGLARIVVMAEHDTGRAPNALEWRRLDADAMLAHNFFHDYQLRALAEYARTSPALRVLGMDDLLTGLPADNPFSRTIYPDIAARIARAVSLCDRLVVSTAALADAYGGGSMDVRVIPNKLDASRWEGLANLPRGGARPRVGWAGANQHLGDLRLLEPVVKATRDSIDWVFLGMCPPSIRPFAAEVHGMVPVASYPAKLASLGLDLAVAPLEDHPFNRAKSNLKLLEYGILGIPVVASSVTPYRDSPALVVSSRQAEWVEGVRTLAGDRDRARRLGAEMRKWVLAGGTLSSTLQDWSRALDPAR